MKFSTWIHVAMIGALSHASLNSPALAADVSGYLGDAPLGYDIPPAPTNPAVLRADLDEVRARLAAPGSVAERDAILDADAYDPDQLLFRFSEAAGTALKPDARPNLIRLIARAQIDQENYIEAAKAANPRLRPYAVDPSIHPCKITYDTEAGKDKGTINPRGSYPSGSAANGYLSGLLLAEVMPSAAKDLIARGIRYGDNRVVCGVHHPVDVEEARRAAAAIFDLLQKNAAFQADLTCARWEADRKATAPMGCLALE